MALEIKLISEFPFGKRPHYSFYDEDGELLLYGEQDQISGTIDALTNDISLIPYTLVIEDMQGEEFFSLHKKLATPLNPLNFSIVYSNGRITTEKGTTYIPPNLALNYLDRKIELVGQVMDLNFALVEGKETIGYIKGDHEKKGKEYIIKILNNNYPLPLYLGAALIIDILYHDH